MSDAADIFGRLQILQQQDWEHLTRVLLRYTVIRGQRTNLAVSAGTIRGVSIDDIVHEAIKDVWSGKRHWNYDRVPLLVFLQNVHIPELLGHSFQSKSATDSKVARPGILKQVGH